MFFLTEYIFYVKYAFSYVSDNICFSKFLIMFWRILRNWKILIYQHMFFKITNNVLVNFSKLKHNFQKSSFPEDWFIVFHNCIFPKFACGDMIVLYNKDSITFKSTQEFKSRLSSIWITVNCRPQFFPTDLTDKDLSRKIFSQFQHNCTFPNSSFRSLTLVWNTTIWFKKLTRSCYIFVSICREVE